MNEMIRYIKRGNKIAVKDQYGNTVKKDTRKVGVMVAIPENGTNCICVGYSLCNTNEGDIFNKATAKKIAFNRAYTYILNPREVNIPESLKGELFAFVKRAKRYFKQYSVPQWLCKYYDYDFNEKESVNIFGRKIEFTNLYKEKTNIILGKHLKEALTNCFKDLPNLQLP